MLADEPRFDALVDVFDRRLAASMGDGAAADKALDRASALFKVGRLLDGLRHLHRARLSLFNGDAGRRLIEATLATATIQTCLPRACSRPPPPTNPADRVPATPVATLINHQPADRGLIPTSLTTSPMVHVVRHQRRARLRVRTDWILAQQPNGRDDHDGGVK